MILRMVLSFNLFTTTQQRRNKNETLQITFSPIQSMPQHPTPHPPPPHSTLPLTDTPHPTPFPQSYRHTSQIQQLLHQPTHHSSNPIFHHKTYNNPITQQVHTVKVPLQQSMMENNDSVVKGKNNIVTLQHQKWLEKNRKFSKPYDDCTRYIDNLSQHKALIRRGPFNIPIDKNSLLSKQTTYQLTNKEKSTSQFSSSQVQTLPITQTRLKSISHSLQPHSNASYKSIFRTKKSLISSSLNNLKPYQAFSEHSQPKNQGKLNTFDRSLDNYTRNYHSLMRKQRSIPQQNIILKNSVNKLVAVDLIKQKLLSNSHLQKNNIQKLQNKFKKKHQIKLKTQQE